MNKKGRVDFGRLFISSIEKAAKEEEIRLAAEAKEEPPQTLDAKIKKIIATNPGKREAQRKNLRRVAVILIGLAILNAAAYVGVEAYRANVDALFGGMQRTGGENGASVQWAADNVYAEQYSDDQAMEAYFKENFPFLIEVPDSIGTLLYVSFMPGNAAAEWTRAEDVTLAQESDPGNRVEFFINAHKSGVEFEAYTMAAQGEKYPWIKEQRVEEVEIQDQKAYVVYAYREKGPYYMDGAYEPYYNEASIRSMGIYWQDDENTYDFSVSTAEDCENWQQIQEDWRQAILTMKPNTDAPEKVLVDAEKDANVPSPPGFNEKLRKRAIGLEDRYEPVKNQPWDTKTLSVETNLALWLKATKDLNLDRAFATTYWDFSLQEIKGDFPRFAGEYMALDDGCTILKKEQIKAGTPLSKTYAGGKKFYRITFKDNEGEEALLFLISDAAIETEPSYNPNQSGAALINGWPLGVDKDRRLVFVN